MWFHFRSGMRPRPPNTCSIHTGKLSLHITSTKMIQEWLFSVQSHFTFPASAFWSWGSFSTCFGAQTTLTTGWVQSFDKSKTGPGFWGESVVEVGCPPERAPEGGHPIPLICRGRKRFVRGNFKRGRDEKNEKRKREHSQDYLDRCMDSFLLLGWSWFGRSLVNNKPQASTQESFFAKLRVYWSDKTIFRQL